MLEELEPKNVFRFFEEITQIPHGSYNVSKINDYLVAFARERGLKYRSDEYCNVIIWKDGSPGYEDADPVIIQGHMDMVAVKDDTCLKDLTVEGLDLNVDGDLLSAEGTSLGGDDGIAVAYALALLDDDTIAHPPLEVVITTDEEAGMVGADFLDVSDLKSHTLINIDSEDEGIFTVSCAGGATAILHLPVKTKEMELAAVEFYLNGFAGGHSGTEIDKGRANSNIALGRLLLSLSKQTDMRLVTINGGEKDNAIPTCAGAMVAVPEEQVEKVQQILQDDFDQLKLEFQTTDPDMELTVTADDPLVRPVFTRTATRNAVTLLCNVPNGVQRMNPEMEHMVQTSLNLGIIRTVEGEIQLSFAVRSACEYERQYMIDKLQYLVEAFGGSIEVMGAYPGWEYRADSPIRDTMVRVYKDQYGEDPVVEGIHAGLECGMFADKIPDLDAISFGPQMYHVHTPKESLSISSTARTWQLLLDTLAALK